MIAVKGDRLSGFVLPIEPVAGDITISASRANAWTIDDTKRLWLSGDVRIAIAQFTFESGEATVWINRIPSAAGLINQVAIYFDEVSDPVRTAGMGARGSRLLVTGSARGEVQLNVAAFNEGRAADRTIIERGENRLGEYLRTLIATPPPLGRLPRSDAAEERERLPELHVGDAPPIEAVEYPQEIEAPPLDAPSIPIFIPGGHVSINAGQVELITDEEENIILASETLIVEYTDDRGEGELSRLSIAAQRGVVFTDPGAVRDLPSMNLTAESVIGIYLEGNVVATDGEYTVRGSRVYYDMRRQRAIMLDGVLRTYSRQLNRTIYARAEEFRQLAQNQWTAEKATVSTSEFFTPHLAIGARDVTITQNPRTADAAPGDTITYIEARSNTVELAGVPVLWWPYLAGEVDDLPIRSIDASIEDNKGFVLKTQWDLFAIAGHQPKDDLDLLLNLDGFTDRGAGGGLEFEYKLDDVFGKAEIYGQFDDGLDKTSSGREVDSEKDFRGVGLLEHHMRLNTHLVMQAQVSYISDETYITTWREDDFEERREYETSLYLRNVDDHTAWTLLARHDLNDFISNSWLLASRQYTVDRLPEFTYRRYGDSLFGDTITYSSEYRASRMMMSFVDHTPDELGIRARGFQIERDAEFDDFLEAQGLPQRWVNRFDTRHEVAMPLSAGPFRIRPFVVGRLTVWDDEFANFSSDSDDMRAFGAAGVTFSTTIQRVFNDVENAVLDLHRLRHIMEPSVTLWYGYSNLDQMHLPVFDEDVESLADATAVRFGLDHTFQTQRGGPGYWRSVDFLRISTSLVLTSSDADLEHPVPQYFEFRPEYSNLGDHAAASFVWLLSDTLAFVGETIYDLDESRIARGSIGTLLQHSPDFSTYVEFRYLDASDTQLLAVGWNYQFTPKYSISLRPQWDFRRDRFRSLRVSFTRSFPDFDLVFGVEHDDIQRDTSFSASMRLRTF